MAQRLCFCFTGVDAATTARLGTIVSSLCKLILLNCAPAAGALAAMCDLMPAAVAQGKFIPHWLPRLLRAPDSSIESHTVTLVCLLRLLQAGGDTASIFTAIGALPQLLEMAIAATVSLKGHVADERARALSFLQILLACCSLLIEHDDANITTIVACGFVPTLVSLLELACPAAVVADAVADAVLAEPCLSLLVRCVQSDAVCARLVSSGALAVLSFAMVRAPCLV